MGFKIPYTNIEIGKVLNIDKKQPISARVIDRIIQRQQVRQREDVGDWRNALLLAESVTNPDRTHLIRVFKDVDLDCHVTGIIGAIKDKIKAKPFNIIDPSGEIDEKKTKLFKKEWFFDFLDFIVEAPFWGYSLVQLGNIKDDSFPEIELVPREYVIPELDLVKKDLFIGKGANDPQNAFFYKENPLKDWFIFIGKKKNMGLFNKAAPHALSKKNLFAEMWQYAELFGMPIRKGHTDMTDPERRKNMELMLGNMGSAAWGAFDTDDKIDFVESKKGGDATKTFVQPIKLSNEEISKGFAHQVATFDEKAFVGSAEVQERIFNDLIVTFLRAASFITNDELITRMVKHRMLPFGFTFKWEAEELLTIMDRAKIITELTKVGYEFSAETVTEKVGIKIEGFIPVGISEPVPTKNRITTIMNDVKELYKNFV